MKLRGAIVAISGSRTGIGWALARALAEQGSALHLIQRQWDDWQLDQLSVLGAPWVKRWTCDLSRAAEVAELTSELGRQRIDILVNNAGLLSGELLEKQTPTAIADLLQVNLTSAVQLTRALLPGMIERGSGLIVNNTSVSAIMRFPCASTYAASKAGLLAFGECLSAELKGTGVGVLSLLTPGIDTAMFSDMQKRYGSHFEPPSEKISPEAYAIKILAAIKRGDEYLLPSGNTRLGLALARHTPRLFKSLATRTFKR